MKLRASTVGAHALQRLNAWNRDLVSQGTFVWKTCRLTVVYPPYYDNRLYNAFPDNKTF